MSDAIKKPLSIIIADGSASHDYLKYLDIMFDVSVIKYEECTPRTKVDLILFTGGEDVNPEYYYQEKGKYTFVNKDRDNYEQKVFNSFYHIPKLGICRGAQFLTVMAGGHLVQHVTGHTQEHSITIQDYGDQMITSTHHQMMFPYNLKDNHYDVIAYSSNFRSNTYLNGDNEEIKLPLDFLEPEIVKYPGINAYCIQGHPEMASASDSIKKITLQLIYNWLFPQDVHRYEPPKIDRKKMFYDDLEDTRNMLTSIKSKPLKFASKPSQYIRTESKPMSGVSSISYMDSAGNIVTKLGDGTISNRYVVGADPTMDTPITPTYRYEINDMGNGMKATQAIPVAPDQALSQQNKQE